MGSSSKSLREMGLESTRDLPLIGALASLRIFSRRGRSLHEGREIMELGSTSVFAKPKLTLEWRWERSIYSLGHEGVSGEGDT